MAKLKLISWNVNGIRAVMRKGFSEFLEKESPDIICLQETKATKDQLNYDFDSYNEYWNPALKKGYSGTAIFSKKEIKELHKEFNGTYEEEKFKDKYGGVSEGRVITADLEKFYLVNVYTPNAKRDLSRLTYREKIWDPIFLDYLKRLEAQKPVIICGDLNVAHKEIDLARPDDNHKNAGFTDEERMGFENYLQNGFVDTFRIFNKDGGNYTWWSNFGRARERNVGWRIDYFLVSESIKDNVKDAFILSDVFGSDHCPIGLVIDL